MIRRALWAAGGPLRAALVGSIRVYQATLSGWLGGQCRFYPSCSQYAQEAIRTQGAIRGSVLSVWRILRCNPFGQGGLEPAPPSRRPGAEHRESYEPVIRSAAQDTGS